MGSRSADGASGGKSACIKAAFLHHPSVYLLRITKHADHGVATLPSRSTHRRCTPKPKIPRALISASNAGRVIKYDSFQSSQRSLAGAVKHQTLLPTSPDLEEAPWRPRLTQNLAGRCTGVRRPVIWSSFRVIGCSHFTRRIASPPVCHPPSLFDLCTVKVRPCCIGGAR